jgi:ADP-ribose pyrophosphatase
MSFTEHCLDSTTLYKSHFIQLLKDEVRLPDGSTGSREYIRHPGAVAVLAMLDNGNLLMERQYRYAAGREFFEIPAGKIDSQEAILRTAQRELLEETGYVASKWTFLTTAWACIGYSDEQISYFLARGLQHQGRNLDEGEFLDVFELSLPDALDWVRQGKINDSKTILGLFWLSDYLQNTPQ